VTAALKKGAKVIFTSRDYVFGEAHKDLKVNEFPLIEYSQVVIHVQELTLEEKSQILYNHIKRGDQPRTFRSAIKPHLPAVAQSKRFLPEIARRLGNPLFTKNMEMNAEGIRRFVEEPVTFLASVLKSLDTKCFAALALVFLNDGALQSPLRPSTAEEGALTRLGATQPDVQVALTAMNGGLVKYVKGDQPTWAFQHPTIHDALASVVATDPERMDIYLQGCPVERLLSEVTCGDIGIEGVKVIVPRNRYDLFAQRLRTHWHEWAKHMFLAYRCDRTFLELYVATDESILQAACNPRDHAWFSHSIHPAAVLLSKLHEYGLVPSRYRGEFIAEVRRRAIEVPDAAFLTSPHVRRMLSEEEIAEILARVKEELLPAISDVVDEWKDSCSRGEDPSGHFQPLLRSLEAYRDALTGDADAEYVIDEAVEAIDRAISRLTEGDENADSLDDYSDRLGTQVSSGERSIFDDIDEGE
jgi:hypothetical protein